MAAAEGSERRRATRDRHAREIELVRSGTDRVEDIAAVLGVSGSTVRRDLRFLAERGDLARTYGGAATTPFRELALGERMALNTRAKAVIARTARRFVPAEGGTVFLDAGSTCAALAEHLAGRSDLVVVTRGLEIATALAVVTGPTVVVVGGEVAPASHGLVGFLVEESLARLRPDVAFLGADAVSPVDGIGEPTLAEARTKEAAASRAREVVVLADAGKLGGAAVPGWAALPAGWALVTDEDDEDALRPYREAGVRVVVAQ